MKFLDYYNEGMHEDKLHCIQYDKIKNEIYFTIALPMWKIEEINEKLGKKIYGYTLKFNNVKNFSSEIELDKIKDYELSLKMKNLKKANTYQMSIFLFIDNLYPKVVFDGELCGERIHNKQILK